MGKQFDDEAKKAAVGAGIGTIGGLLNSTTPLKGPASAQIAGNFAQTSVQALRHGAPIGSALGAGATAAVGGPAVVAAAVAAAPFVAAAALIGVAGYGLFKLFED